MILQRYIQYKFITIYIGPGRLAAWLKDVGAALYSDHFIYRHSLLYYAVHSLPTGYR